MLSGSLSYLPAVAAGVKSTMKREYLTELSELPETYETCRTTNAISEMVDVVGVPGPMLYVGSGGALALARLAADLHISSTGDLAVAVTPIEAATIDVAPDTGLVLFTARGRHPDAALAVRAARARGARHLGVVSAHERHDLPEALASPDVRIGTVPTPPDGFLATNSLLAMATMLCRAHRAALPEVLEAFQRPHPRPTRPLIMAITGQGLSSVGLDLEARLSETGLASVQLTDFRNVAHGRHVGLVRNIDRITVVTASDSRSQQIADRTLALLPALVDHIPLHSSHDWPASILDLLVSSMHLTASTGVAAGVDPGRPGVAPFGRRLYHLPIGRLIETPTPEPINRKLHRAAGLERATLQVAEQDWLQQMHDTPIRGVVLDYDGTCCPTWDRFRPPPVHVQAEVLRLIEAGITIGFATGRGRSLHDVTRSWLPEAHWDAVHVGLYNGTCVLRLADDPPDRSPCDGSLAEAADRLEAETTGLVTVERRRTQVSVSSSDGRTLGERLLPVVLAVLARPPALLCKAAASGHAVDVIANDSSKVAVLSTVAAASGGALLAIGDQGQVGGNDFEMLAALQTTLSVDRCSADPTRCWNLDQRGERGPQLLVRYLKSLQVRRSVARFRWRKP